MGQPAGENLTWVESLTGIEPGAHSILSVSIFVAAGPLFTLFYIKNKYEQRILSF